MRILYSLIPAWDFQDTIGAKSILQLKTRIYTYREQIRNQNDKRIQSQNFDIPNFFSRRMKSRDAGVNSIETEGF